MQRVAEPGQTVADDGRGGGGEGVEGVIEGREGDRWERDSGVGLALVGVHFEGVVGGSGWWGEVCERRPLLEEGKGV